MRSIQRSGQLIGEFSVPSGAGSEPQGIAAGPDGALWFTEAGTGLVGRLDPSAAQPGTSDGITEYETKYTDHISAIDRPVQLVTADGYLWITLAGLGGGLNRLDPSSAQTGTDDGIEFFPMPTTDSGPEGITIDPGTGDLWVSEYGAGKVVRVDPAAVVENQTAGMTETATPGFSPLIGTPGHDGQLWFAGPTNGDALLELDPTNPATQGPLSNGITGAPNGDATDAAGDVWFTEFTAGAVGVVQLAPAPTAGNPTIAPAQPLQDQLESCDPDAVDWTDSPVFSYQWLLDGNAIPGGTASSYTPLAGDIGHQLSCRVTGANASGATDATSGAAAVQAPALTPGTPTITGTAQSGQTLTCDPDAADWTERPNVVHLPVATRRPADRGGDRHHLPADRSGRRARGHMRCDWPQRGPVGARAGHAGHGYAPRPHGRDADDPRDGGGRTDAHLQSQRHRLGWGADVHVCLAARRGTDRRRAPVRCTRSRPQTAVTRSRAR